MQAVWAFLCIRVSQSEVREPLVVREGIAGGSWVGTFTINELIQKYT